MSRHRSKRAALLWVAGLLVLTGCTSLGPDTEAASQTALDFYRAVAAIDGMTACSLLAPSTAAEVAHSADKPCPEAVLEQDLAPAGTVTQAQAFGTAAQVVMDGDVVFLTDSGGPWKITAAGCTALGERPYRCSISGS